MSELHLDKLDIDALYNEAEKNGCEGECASCGEHHVLCCVCGACFKYCHDDYFHEEIYDPMYDDWDDQ